MKKLLLLITLFFFFLASHAEAQTDFNIDAEITYSINENGVTNVQNIITIENRNTDLFSSSYIHNLISTNPQDITVSYNSTPLDFSLIENDGNSSIKIEFPDKVVGKGKTRIFNINYEVSEFAKKTGDVWEITIPKIDDDSFRNYILNVNIPKSFGNEAYVTPEAGQRSESESGYHYVFEKETVSGLPITAGFGKFQVFSFTLNYHLENPLRSNSEIEIALPPDTSTQKVYFTNISPEPENVRTDIDGNWLAKYTLNPRQRVDITVIGSVQIYSNPRNTFTQTKEQLDSNLESSAYWQSEDPAIKKLASELETPENIYNYVTKGLKYDYSKVKTNPKRLGALNALDDPESAICMEFTDLFIAIARASGIPAREINGYAYTENSKIQPLSLVSDVLHAWPEYWNDKKNTWVPVDPTWGATSGIDYFNKLDLRHFAFVIHGADPEKPYSPGSYKLGPNPQKDVFVNFGELPENRQGKIEITTRTEKLLPFKRRVVANVKNTGLSAFYNIKTHIYFDSELKKETVTPVLPPYSNITIKKEIPFSFLSLNTPDIIKIRTQGSEVEIPSPKIEDRIIQLFLVFVGLTSFVIIILKKMGKIHLKG